MNSTDLALAQADLNTQMSTLPEAPSKINELAKKKDEKLATLAGRVGGQSTNILGSYDADSVVWKEPGTSRQPANYGKVQNTGRLTGDGYYVNSPELKDKNFDLTQEGINARVQADNYAMGVDAPNFAAGDGLDPKYYEQYKAAMDPALAVREEEGGFGISPTGAQGKYGRDLYTAQSAEMPTDMTDYLLDKGQGRKVMLEGQTETTPVEKTQDFSGLKEALKARESSGDYKSVNDYGYVGAYQFGAARLSDLGIVKPGTKNSDLNNADVWTGKYGASSKEDFLNNPDIQEQVADDHMQSLGKQLSGDATSQQDLMGKIAAAHLLGVQGSRDLSKTDANDTSGQEYYDLGIKAAGTAKVDYSAVSDTPYWSNLVKSVAGSIGATAADVADSFADTGATVGQKAYEALSGDKVTVKDLPNLEKLGFNLDSDGNIRHYWGYEKDGTTSREAFKKLTGADDTAYRATTEKFNTTMDSIWGSDASITDKVGSTVVAAWDSKEAIPQGVADSLAYLYALTKQPLSMVAGATNQHLDERLKITGEAADATTTLAVAGGTAVELAADYVAGKMSLGVGKGLGSVNRTVVDNMFKVLPASLGESITAKVLTKTVQKAVGLAAAGTEEFSTEAFQEALGMIVERAGTEKYDGKKIWGLLEPKAQQAIRHAGYQGLLVGVGQHVVGEAVNTGVRKPLIAKMRKVAEKKAEAQPEGTITPEDIASTKTRMQQLHQKVNGPDATLEAADLQEVGQLEKDFNKIPDAQTDKKVGNEFLKRTRASIVKKLNDASDEEIKGMEMGSKDLTTSFITNVLEDSGYAIEESLVNKLDQLASNAGLSEGFVRKTMEMVDKEATTSDKGYVTYGNVLAELRKSPEENTAAISKYEGKLTGFLNSQTKYVNTLKSTIRDIEKDIASGVVGTSRGYEKTGKGWSYKVKALPGLEGPYVVHISDDGGNLSINPATYNLVDTKSKNVTNIQKALGEVGPTAEPVTTEAVEEVITPTESTTTEVTAPPTETPKPRAREKFIAYVNKSVADGVDIEEVLNVANKNKAEKTRNVLVSYIHQQYEKAAQKKSTQPTEVAPESKAQEPVVETTGEEVVSVESTETPLATVRQLLADLKPELAQKKVDLKGFKERLANGEAIGDIVYRASQEIAKLEKEQKDYTAQIKAEGSAAQVVKTSSVIENSANSEVASEKLVAKANRVDITRLDARLGKVFKTLTTKVQKSLATVVFNDNGKSPNAILARLDESPLRLLLGKNGRYPVEVAEAMSLAINGYLAERFGELRYNDDAQIGKMLGTTGRIPAQVRSEMKDIGRFENNEADGIGRIVLKHLGIAANGDAEHDLDSRLAADAGATALAVMEELGYVERVQEITTTDITRNRLLVEGRKGSEEAKEEAYNQVATIKMAKSKADTWLKVTKDNQKINDELKEALGIEAFVKDPRFEKTNGDKEFVTRNAEQWTELTAKQQEALNTVENMEHVIDIPKVNLLKGMWGNNVDSIDNVTAEQIEVMKLFGWENTDEAHVDYRSNMKAKNGEIFRSIQDLLAFSEVAGDKSIYFNYFFSKNGRFFIDSSKINPQTDKLHRFLINVAQEDKVVTSKGMPVFKTAVVQALDGSKVVEFAEKGDGTSEVVDGEVIRGLGAVDKQGQEANITQFEKIRENTTIREAIEAIKSGVDVNVKLLAALQGVDHPGHALAALHELIKYESMLKSGRTEFSSNMTMETDAVTSGFILGLLTNPIMAWNELKRWLAKGGIWFGSHKLKSFGEWKEDKQNHDSYETGALEVQAELDSDEYKNRAVVKYVGKVKRAFMKNPLMVFVYGSGPASIKRSIGTRFADQAIAELSKESTSEETAVLVEGMMKDRISALRVNLQTAKDAKGDTKKQQYAISKSIQRYQKVYADFSKRRKGNNYKGFRNASMTVPRVNNKMQAIYDVVNEEVQAVHGQVVSDYLSTTFESLVEMRASMNTVFTGVFGVFKAEYDKRVYKVAKGRKATKNEVDAILEEMMNEGKIPGILTVDAKRDSERAPIMKTQRVSAGKKHQVQVKLKPKQRNVNPLVYDMVANPTAAAVINIHYLDGALIMRILSDALGLGVHDAYVTHVNNVVGSTKKYNKAAVDLTQQFNMLERVQEEFDKSMKQDPEAFKQAMIDARRSIGDKDFSTVDAEKNLEEVSKSLAGNIKLIKANKQRMVEEDMTSAHMAGPDGSMYTRKGTKPSVTEEPVIETQVSPKVESAKIGNRKALITSMLEMIKGKPGITKALYPAIKKVLGTKGKWNSEDVKTKLEDALKDC